MWARTIYIYIYIYEHNGTHTLESWVTWLFDLPLHQLGIPSLRRSPPVAQSLQLGAPSAWSPVQPGRVEQTIYALKHRNFSFDTFFQSWIFGFLNTCFWWSSSFGGTHPAVPWGSPWYTNPSMASGWGVPIWALERHQFSLISERSPRDPRDCPVPTTSSISCHDAKRWMEGCQGFVGYDI